jgi:exodeoxyribonuclease VII small subunit
VKEKRNPPGRARGGFIVQNHFTLNIRYMAKKDFSFNEAVKTIEEILQNIEKGNLDVDKLSDEVKRASELIKQCQKKLRSTEEEINSIFKDLV